MHVWILLLELWPGASDSLHFQSLSCVATEKSFHLFHLPACRDHPLLWAHGAASAHVSCCLSWLRRLAWRSSQGWLLVAPGGILPSTTTCRCTGAMGFAVPGASWAVALCALGQLLPSLFCWVQTALAETSGKLHGLLIWTHLYGHLSLFWNQMSLCITL